VQPLQNQTGGNQKVPHLGCEQEEEESWSGQVGVRLGIVMKEKKVFHVLVRMNYMSALSQFA
jgi:hypothetical protein